MLLSKCFQKEDFFDGRSSCLLLTLLDLPSVVAYRKGRKICIEIQDRKFTIKTISRVIVSILNNETEYEEHEEKVLKILQRNWSKVDQKLPLELWPVITAKIYLFERKTCAL